MNSVECTKHEIGRIISNSSVPEDDAHARNTLEWLLKLDPRADVSLQIAALGHDIERAVDGRKTRRCDFSDYDEFKAAHARNSAGILKEIMETCGVKKDIINEVCRLVSLHETGGEPRADLLRECDSISFFDVNLPFYFERNGMEETVRRGIWGYRKLSRIGRRYVRNISYDNKTLNTLLNTIIEKSSYARRIK